MAQSHYKAIGTILFIGVIGIAAYVLLQNNPVTNEQPLEKFTVRLSWVHQAQFAGLYVAQEKGFYREMGLDVELLPLNLEIEQIGELASGKVDASIMEAHQLLVGVDQGADVRAVGAVYQTNPHALAVRADSGIEGPEDFEGKVIGLAGGKGEGNALFRIFAERFNNPDTITYINLGFATIDDFATRKADVIDLYSIDQPYLAAQRGIPLRIISLDAYGFSTYGDVIGVSSELLRTNPEVVQKFIKATFEGWEYALQNPDEAAQITLAWTSGDYNDLSYQRHIMFQSIPLVRGTTDRLGNMDLVPWSTLYESMRQAGALTRDFDVRDVYTNEFIQ